MAEKSAILASLRDLVGSEHAKGDAETVSLYAVDGLKPWAVVFPGSPEEVSRLVRLAVGEKLSLVPWGSGSKMGAGQVPSRLELVICTQRLNRILDMDTDNLTATAQAGVRFKEIQAALGGEENRCYLPLKDASVLSDQAICSDRENKGCFIPMMPQCSNSATLGGIVAANSSGPTRLLYGLPRDMVLGVRYVAPSGEIIGMGGKTVKNVSGYDVSKLMIGSWGSLGILCEMTFRLLPLPERLHTSLFSFRALSDASGFVAGVFGTALLPAAIEVVNKRACEFLPLQRGRTWGKQGYVVAVALEGVHEAVERMRSEIGAMATTCGAEGSQDVEGDEHYVFWDGYSNLSADLAKGYPDLVSVKINYPLSRYVEMIELVESLASGSQLDHVILVHAGSGVARVHFLLTQKPDQVQDGILSFSKRVLDRCREIDGNAVVERAKSVLKQKLPVWGLPRNDQIVMKRIKEELDPLGLFCPGRLSFGI